MEWQIMTRFNEVKESDIKSGVIQYLTFMQNKGELVFTRVNSGMILLKSENGKNRVIKLATTGTLDIFILCQGTLILLETKKPNEQLSPAQQLFAEAWEHQGAKVFRIDNIEQAQQIIEKILAEKEQNGRR